jgi:hypothetical protein
MSRLKRPPTAGLGRVSGDGGEVLAASKYSGNTAEATARVCASPDRAAKPAASTCAFLSAQNLGLPAQAPAYHAVMFAQFGWIL